VCLILVSQSGSKLPKQLLEHSFDNNPDGCGMAHVIDGKIVVKKGFWKFSKFFDYYSKITDVEITPSILIHMRVSTGTPLVAGNCQPYRLSPNCIFAHNGNLEYHGIKSEGDKSDTRVFVEKFLRPMFNDKNNKGVYKTPSFMWLMKNHFSHRNKFVFLDNNGEFLIVNEFQGDDINNMGEKVWASNDTWHYRRMSWPTNPFTRGPKKDNIITGFRTNTHTKYGFTAQEQETHNKNQEIINREEARSAMIEDDYINAHPDCIDAECGFCNRCLKIAMMEDDGNWARKDAEDYINEQNSKYNDNFNDHNNINSDTVDGSDYSGQDPDWSVGQEKDLIRDLETCCLCKSNIYNAKWCRGSWYCDDCFECAFPTGATFTTGRPKKIKKSETEVERLARELCEKLPPQGIDRDVSGNNGFGNDMNMTDHENDGVSYYSPSGPQEEGNMENNMGKVELQNHF